jgi:hypothetical protein
MKIQTFDYSLNLLEVLQWRNSVSEKLIGILQDWNSFYEEWHTEFWEDWYNDVFNLQTANDFGLSVWAIILDFPQINDTIPANYPAFSFNRAENFNHGNFLPNASTIHLTTEELRIALKLQYYKWVSNCVPSVVNKFLAFVFGSDLVYTVDASALPTPDPMVWEYRIGYDMPVSLFDAIVTYKLFVRPTAVRVRYEFTDTPIFQFNAPYNFNHGNFKG